ncbi:hypothetical protein V5799_029834 [Amblyomma americanum]|uniref:Uncharacterized protein n=1 Tax=Amblyomma americanum TaxID=6943 RepID=A0AAQ4EQ53_AMBAM
MPKLTLRMPNALRRKMQLKNSEEQLNQTEKTKEVSTPDAVLEAPNVSGESPDDTSPSGDCSEEQVVAVGCPKKREPNQRVRRSFAEWKSRIRKTLLARRRSSESASTCLHQQQPKSSRCRGLTFTYGVEPPESLRSTKPSPMSVPGEPQLQLKERRTVEPDSPFSYSYVRNALLKYERVDNWLKDAQHEYLKLIHWKRPLRTVLLLTVAFLTIWMGCLLQLLLAPAVVYLTGQFFHMGSPIGSGQTKKTFQEILALFGKTESLFSWKNANASLCFPLALLTLLAFWKEQELAVQFAVTAILLKVFVADEGFRRFHHLASRYDLIGRA